MQNGWKERKNTGAARQSTSPLGSFFPLFIKIEEYVTGKVVALVTAFFIGKTAADYRGCFLLS